MLSTRTLGAVVAVAAAALAAPASAVTTISAVINTATLAPNTLNTVAINPVTLNVGDTFDLTLTFSGGPLTLAGGTAIWTGLLVGSGPSGTINTDSVMSFLGGSSNLVGSTGVLNQDNLFVHVGSYFGNSLFQTAPGNITFTAVNQVTTLLSDNIGQARDYSSAFFYYETSVVAVPEPSSWAMMIAGFGLVGAALRRRSNFVAA